MSQTEVAEWRCIPVCSAAFAFAGDDPLPRRAATMTVADDSGNDRVNITAAASGATTHNPLSATHGKTTADTITAVTATPIVQQQVAGLASGGQYTFYVWAKVASGTKQVSIAIVDNGYAGYLAGPTSITLTTAWQRFKITGTLAGSPGCGSLCASSPATATTGPLVQSTFGARASSRATIRSTDTRARGRRRPP